MNQKRKTVGLALGSGGVKGFAHIGVIEVLLENNIPIDFIAGTSIGAWVGANYALLRDIKILKELTVGKRKEKLSCLWDISLSGGLIRGEKVKKLLTEWLGKNRFEDTSIPFKSVATNIITGEPHIFDSGSLVDGVRASIAIPSMFKPIQLGEKILVDGGICCPVPVNIVKQMGADIVIAINLDNYQKNSWFKKEDINSITKVAGRSLDIMRHYLAKESCREADFIIEPKLKESESVIWKKYFIDGQGEYIVEAGREEAKKIIKEINEAIT